MANLNINTSKTQFPNLRKFSINYFFVKHGKYKYDNPEEAENSPLAQLIFSLSYVKTIFIAENFVAVEILYENLWEKAEKEIKSKIKEFLTSNIKAIKNEPKVFPVEVYTQMDPNPGSLKFVANKKLVLENVQYDFNKDFSESPLATALFEFEYVKRIEIEHNFIKITKGGAVQWDEITMELREFIRKYLMQGKDILLHQVVGDLK